MMKPDSYNRPRYELRQASSVLVRLMLVLLPILAPVPFLSSAWGDEPATLATPMLRNNFAEKVVRALAVDRRIGRDDQHDLLQERLEALLDDELGQVGLPRIPNQHRVWFKLHRISPRGGRFFPSAWLIALDTKLLDDAMQQPDKAVEVSVLLYHEARHVEQYYLMARWLAAKGRFGELYTVLQLPRYIAETARVDFLPAADKRTKTVVRWFAQFSPENQATLQAFNDACEAVREGERRRESLAMRLAAVRA